MRLAVLVAGAALLLAGCGYPDATANSGPAATTQQTTPTPLAPIRSTVTASSRVMITIATQAARRCSDTSEISAPTTRSLSASGSINLPNVVTESLARAR